MKKRVKKPTAKGVLRWTSKVIYGWRCDGVCNKTASNISEVTPSLIPPVIKGGDLSKAKLGFEVLKPPKSSDVARGEDSQLLRRLVTPANP